VRRPVEIADARTADLEAIHVGKDVLRFRGPPGQQSEPDWCQGIPFLSAPEATSLHQASLHQALGLVVSSRVV
jgi:hypothetical protein